jgi:hypothetical protein
VRALTLCASSMATLLAAVGGFLWYEGPRSRHLAVPVLSDPSLPPAEAAPLDELPACRVRRRARVPGRVTALLQGGDGALWIGTFDRGVFRAAAGAAPREVGRAAGRELFVNDLAEHEGRIWVATQRGVLVLERGGERILTIAPDAAVTALSRIGGRLHGGTARGLVKLSLDSEAAAVEIRGPFGDPVRVNAVAVSGETVWLGSSDGVYSLPASALEREGPLTARWHPPALGSPPARTDVVTALAPFGDGVLAGTDDGGLVRVTPRATAALRFAEPRANEVNPGAAAAVETGAAFGTQGGGLLVASSPAGRPSVGRPLGWPAGQVSAVRAAGRELLVGTADGSVLAVDCASLHDRDEVAERDRPFDARAATGGEPGARAAQARR